MNTSNTNSKSKDGKKGKKVKTRRIMRTLSGECFEVPHNVDDDCTPHLGPLHDNGNKPNSDSTLKYLMCSPTGCTGIQSTGQASIKSKFEYTGQH
jgi:hypothetical protein